MARTEPLFKYGISDGWFWKEDGKFKAAVVIGVRWGREGKGREGKGREGKGRGKWVILIGFIFFRSALGYDDGSGKCAKVIPSRH